MILDNETTLVYLSDCLRIREAFFKNLEGTLVAHGINYQMLPNTSDIWAVDYMPIQVDIGEFVQFTYQPDYLQNARYISTQTNPREICREIGLRPNYSRIKLDGGNVIKGKHWVIVTDKIFSENPSFTKKQIIGELERLFDLRVVIIPREPYDFTGHADGTLRYYNEETVLVNKYKPGYSDSFQLRLKRVLKSERIQVIEIPFNPYENISHDDATGYYINYLQMRNFIVLPAFGIKEDEEAAILFQELFPDCVIETISCNDVSKEGGVLNCISWNILA